MEGLTGKRTLMVLGTPRSGTTWVGKCLSFADEVCYLFEPDAARQYDSPVNKKQESYWFSPDWLVDPELKDEEFHSLRDTVIQHLDHVVRQEVCSDHNSVLIKIPRIERMAPVLNKLKPDRIVFTRRSPFAVVGSYMTRIPDNRKLKKLVDDQYDCFRSSLPAYGISFSWDRPRNLHEKLALMMLARLDLVDRVLDPYHYMIFDYEKACFQPVDFFQKCYEFTGLHWTEEIKQKIEMTSHPNEEVVGWHTTKRVSNKRAYGWRTEMPPEVVDDISALFEDLSVTSLAWPGNGMPPLSDDERKKAAEFIQKKSKAKSVP